VQINIANIREGYVVYAVYTTVHLLHKRRGRNTNRLNELSYDDIATVLVFALKNGLNKMQDGKIKIIFGDNEKYAAILIAKEKRQITVVSVIAEKQIMYVKKDFYMHVHRSIIIDDFRVKEETAILKEQHPKIFTGIRKVSEIFLGTIIDEQRTLLEQKLKVFMLISMDEKGNNVARETIEKDEVFEILKKAFKKNNPEKKFKNILIKKNEKYAIIHVLSPKANDPATDRENKVMMIRYFFLDKRPKAIINDKADFIDLTNES